MTASTGHPASPAIIKAAEAAWARYRSTVMMGGTPAERDNAYTAARRAEHKLWIAEGSEAARA